MDIDDKPNDAKQALTAEDNAWLKHHKLPKRSADELLAELCTQCAAVYELELRWLGDFIRGRASRLPIEFDRGEFI
ncbi:MAG TPA: hypothetical protein VGJ20_43275 [Xanthobacteraceae bacterium]|jgi:hypothetical protein